MLRPSCYLRSAHPPDTPVGGVRGSELRWLTSPAAAAVVGVEAIVLLRRMPNNATTVVIVVAVVGGLGRL